MTAYTSTIFGPTIGYVQPGSLYYYYPPDNALAVGPTLGSGQSGIVMAENASIEWGMIGASTTLGSVTTETLKAFFQPLSPYGQIFDPRVVYDSANGRFVVVADETNSSFSKSTLLVAVSKDSNPADGWYFQAVNSSIKGTGRTTSWADYPTVAVDGKHIIISTNQFTSSGAYRGSYQFVLNDFSTSAGTTGGLYGGSTSAVTTKQWSSAYSSVQEVSAPAALGSYGVSYTGNGLAVTFNPQSGTATGYSVSLGSIDAGTSTGYTAPQPNSSWSLDAGDGRVTSATYSNGKLYAAFEVNTGAAGPAVHWVELDTTKLSTGNAVVAQGNVTLTGATTFNPSIAMDGAGDVIINFTASGTSLYATDYFAVMPAGTTSFSTPVAYQASASVAYAQGSGNVSRWGDYSSAIVDPNNPSAGFWLSNEYATGSSSWGTVLDQVTLGTAGTVLSFSAPGTASPSGGTTTTTTTLTPDGDVPARVLAMSDLLGGISFNDLFGSHAHGLHPQGPGQSDPFAHAGGFAGLSWPGPSEHGPFGWYHNG